MDIGVEEVRSLGTVCNSLPKMMPKKLMKFATRVRRWWTPSSRTVRALLAPKGTQFMKECSCVGSTFSHHQDKGTLLLLPLKFSVVCQYHGADGCDRLHQSAGRFVPAFTTAAAAASPLPTSSALAALPFPSCRGRRLFHPLIVVVSASTPMPFRSRKGHGGTSRVS